MVLELRFGSTKRHFITQLIRHEPLAPIGAQWRGPSPAEALARESGRRARHRLVGQEPTELGHSPHPLIGAGRRLRNRLFIQNESRFPLFPIEPQRGVQVRTGTTQAQPGHPPGHHQKQCQGPLQALYWAQWQRLDAASIRLYWKQ